MGIFTLYTFGTYKTPLFKCCRPFTGGRKEMLEYIARKGPWHHFNPLSAWCTFFHRDTSACIRGDILIERGRHQ